MMKFSRRGAERRRYRVTVYGSEREFDRRLQACSRSQPGSGLNHERRIRWDPTRAVLLLDPPANGSARTGMFYPSPEERARWSAK